MASIKLILRTSQKDPSGHCPLYIRIIKDRKTKFITVGLKLKETEWDEAKQKVKKNHSNSARMNASLAQKIADAEGHIADLERNLKSVSIKKIKETIKGKAVPNFFEYAYDRCEKIKGSVSYGTYKNYKLYIKKFENFIGSKDLFFDNITVSLLMQYISDMGTKKGNGVTTQRYSIMILAIMAKEAIKEELIPETMYPYNKLSLKKNPGKRVFLNNAQIKDLADLELKDGKKASLWRDLFLFSVYAGGLRFSDVIELEYSNFNLEEQRIKKVIRKTGRMHQFKIGKVALDILAKYMKEDMQHDDYIFPIIKDKAAYNNSEQVRYELASRENGAANFQLGKMGKAIKLPFPLSFHLSRHSFATNALNNGMRIEHVSKLMDHQDISTTQIYAKIISEELDKAVDKFIF